MVHLTVLQSYHLLKKKKKKKLEGIIICSWLSFSHWLRMGSAV